MKRKIVFPFALFLLMNVFIVPHQGVTGTVNHDVFSPIMTKKVYAKQQDHQLMSREKFKDWLTTQEVDRTISLIQQHHTWIPDYNRFDGKNHLTLLQGMHNYHVNQMGWKTTAQHITTFPDGKIAVSRPLHMAGDGSIGSRANNVGITIENVGNFDKGNDVMTEEQKETIVYITALLCIKFGLTPSIDSITYHHWWNHKTEERVLDSAQDHEVKSCPGTGFFGGNSTEDAKKNFYPLVKEKMDEILAAQ